MQSILPPNSVPVDSSAAAEAMVDGPEQLSSAHHGYDEHHEEAGRTEIQKPSIGGRGAERRKTSAKSSSGGIAEKRKGRNFRPSSKSSQSSCRFSGRGDEEKGKMFSSDDSSVGSTGATENASSFSSKAGDFAPVAYYEDEDEMDEDVVGDDDMDGYSDDGMDGYGDDNMDDGYGDDNMDDGYGDVDDFVSQSGVSALTGVTGITGATGPSVRRFVRALGDDSDGRPGRGGSVGPGVGGGGGRAGGDNKAGWRSRSAPAASRRPAELWEEEEEEEGFVAAADPAAPGDRGAPGPRRRSESTRSRSGADGQRRRSQESIASSGTAGTGSRSSFSDRSFAASSSDYSDEPKTAGDYYGDDYDEDEDEDFYEDDYSEGQNDARSVVSSISRATGASAGSVGLLLKVLRDSKNISGSRRTVGGPGNSRGRSAIQCQEPGDDEDEETDALSRAPTEASDEEFMEAFRLLAELQRTAREQQGKSQKIHRNRPRRPAPTQPPALDGEEEDLVPAAPTLEELLGQSPRAAAPGDKDQPETVETQAMEDLVMMLANLRRNSYRDPEDGIGPEEDNKPEVSKGEDPRQRPRGARGADGGNGSRKGDGHGDGRGEDSGNNDPRRLPRGISNGPRMGGAIIGRDLELSPRMLNRDVSGLSFDDSVPFETSGRAGRGGRRGGTGGSGRQLPSSAGRGGPAGRGGGRPGRGGPPLAAGRGQRQRPTLPPGGASGRGTSGGMGGSRGGSEQPPRRPQGNPGGRGPRPPGSGGGSVGGQQRGSERSVESRRVLRQASNRSRRDSNGSGRSSSGRSSNGSGRGSNGSGRSSNGSGRGSGRGFKGSGRMGSSAGRPGILREMSGLSVDDSITFPDEGGGSEESGSIHTGSVPHRGSKLKVVDELSVQRQREAAPASAIKKKKKKKTASANDLAVRESLVSFSSVEVRHYERVLGDHPCTHGPPLTIGWDHYADQTQQMTVDEHEEMVEEMRLARGDDGVATIFNLVLSRDQRESMLTSLGYTKKEMASAVRKAARAKRQRRQTVQNLGAAARVEELAESAGRTVKKVLSIKALMRGGNAEELPQVAVNRQQRNGVVANRKVNSVLNRQPVRRPGRQGIPLEINCTDSLDQSFGTLAVDL